MSDQPGLLQRERAYRSFTEKLLSRSLTPGQFVSQRELVDLTDMTLGAIREMIPRLEADGLIRTVPHRGLQIPQVDMELIRNAFQLRLLLEREAVAAFARDASESTIAKLAAEHREIREAARTEVTAELIERAQKIDWDFHDQMIDGLGNALISNIYRVNSIKIRLIRGQDTRILPELVVSVMDEHLAIFDALASRDPAAAVAALERHIGSAKMRAIRI